MFFYEFTVQIISQASHYAKQLQQCTQTQLFTVLFSDVSGIDFEVREPTKDSRVQRVVEEQMRERRLITDEKRVVIDESRKRADIVPEMIPAGVQEVDDDWFDLLDTTPSKKRSIPSGGSNCCMSYSLCYPGIASGERQVYNQQHSYVFDLLFQWSLKSAGLKNKRTE